MRHSVIMGGFGGQGIMMMGRLLAHAATKAGLEAVWIPSYTPEMRHGIADCFVVVADSPIGELSLARVDTVIAMSDGALKRHGGSVRPGGLLILDRSIVRGEAGAEPDLVVVDGPLIPPARVWILLKLSLIHI